MAVLLSIGSQIINQLSTAAGIFSGENVQQGWDSTTKANNALYITGQLNLSVANINIVYDPDLLDNPIVAPNVDVTTSPAIFKGV
jgi:hypothetical protein